MGVWGVSTAPLHTDTELQVLAIQTEVVFTEISCNLYLYDTSNYPRILIEEFWAHAP